MAFTAILRRSLTKAVPLAASRLTASHRAIHSAAAVSSLRRAAAAAAVSVPRRFISSTAAVKGAASDKKLLDVIASEIHCAEDSEDHGKSVAAPDDFPFSIEDNAGEQTVTLTRDYDGETVSVEVSMPNFVDEEEEDVDDDDDDEEQTSTATVPLLVTVTKKDGKAPYLEFDCTAFPDEIRINGLSLKNTGVEDQLAYEGPDFYDLDANLQKAFHKYLEIRGVKPSTTNFLHEYMMNKDNKEYLRWLKDVKKFIEA